MAWVVITYSTFANLSMCRRVRYSSGFGAIILPGERQKFAGERKSMGYPWSFLYSAHARLKSHYLLCKLTYEVL